MTPVNSFAPPDATAASRRALFRDPSHHGSIEASNDYAVAKAAPPSMWSPATPSRRLAASPMQTGDYPMRDQTSTPRSIGRLSLGHNATMASPLVPSGYQSDRGAHPSPLPSRPLSARLNTFRPGSTAPSRSHAPSPASFNPRRTFN